MKRFICLLISVFACLQGFSQEYFLYTGTYTDGESKGIYVYTFNASTGEIKPLSVATEVENPSYLAVAPGGKFLYAVNENGGSSPGEVSSFSINKSDGSLTFINKVESGGDHPCYVSIDESGKWALVGNYTGGSLSAFKINEDGSLPAFQQLIQHTGKGANPQRQEKAHVHAAAFSPNNEYVLVPDLGMDQVFVYKFDPSALKPLGEKPVSFVGSKPGSGPRHVDFHPSRPYVYVMEELSGTVAVYRFEDGKLVKIQNVSSHPSSYKGEKGSADIHVSPDGQHLYASNRGQSNTIAVYAINSSLGMLKLRNIVPSKGTKPRNFVIDPTGNYLLVANQGTNNIVVFRRNKSNGVITPTGKQVSVPSPVCLKFLEK